MSLGGCGVDGHLDAEGFELAEVAADPAVAACLLVVPAGAEVGEHGPGVSRRSRSPRKVSVANTLITRSAGRRSSSALREGTSLALAARSMRLASRLPVRRWAKCRPS